MSADRFVVRRRFSDWLGEVFDVIDTESGGTIAVVGAHQPGGPAKEEAERLAAHENRVWAMRQEVAMRE